jgi:hypothetical protein
MSRDDSEAFERKVRRVALWGSLTVLVVIGLGLTLIGTLYDEIDQTWALYLLSVGASVVASVIVYTLISVFVEPLQRRVASRETSAYAIELANREFQRRFAVALPLDSFEASSLPKGRFRDAFVVSLVDSSRYDFKGSDGSFTTFRLHALRGRPELRRLSERRLCLVDPRSERAVRGYSELNLIRRGVELEEGAVSEEMESLRLEIFTSLAGLFDLRNDVPTQVFFHTELPHYRCEIFDNALFLTYYSGPSDYPENLQYGATSRPYRIYSQALESSRRFSEGVLLFAGHDPSADSIRNDAVFEERLAGLGYFGSLATLRAHFATRVSAYGSEMRRARLSLSELF